MIDDKIKEEYILKLNEIYEIEDKAVNLCKKLKVGRVKFDLEKYPLHMWNDISNKIEKECEILNMKTDDLYIELDNTFDNPLTIILTDEEFLGSITQYEIECEPETCLLEINDILEFHRDIPPFLLNNLLDKNILSEIDKIKIDNYLNKLDDFEYLNKIEKIVDYLNNKIANAEVEVRNYINKKIKK